MVTTRWLINNRDLILKQLQLDRNQEHASSSREFEIGQQLVNISPTVRYKHTFKQRAGDYNRNNNRDAYAEIALDPSFDVQSPYSVKYFNNTYTTTNTVTTQVKLQKTTFATNTQATHSDKARYVSNYDLPQPKWIWSELVFPILLGNQNRVLLRPQRCWRTSLFSWHRDTVTPWWLLLSFLLANGRRHIFRRKCCKNRLLIILSQDC